MIVKKTSYRNQPVLELRCWFKENAAKASSHQPDYVDDISGAALWLVRNETTGKLDLTMRLPEDKFDAQRARCGEPTEIMKAFTDEHNRRMRGADPAPVTEDAQAPSADVTSPEPRPVMGLRERLAARK